MIRFMMVALAVCLTGGAVQAGLDRGDCRVAGSSLQFCDPAGVPCTTSAGKPGTCVQRREGCQCVPGRGLVSREIVDLCHFDEVSGKFVGLSVSERGAEAHLERHPEDCLLEDGPGCVEGVCDAELGCIQAPNDDRCGDGIFCNGQETCDPDTGACVAVSACPPHTEGCLVFNGECDEENDVCLSVVDESLCDDGEFCNGQERCNPETGACEAVSACPPRIEGCLIINGECDEVNDVCVDVIDETLCDDGQFCNGLETCDPDTGACVALSACPPRVEGCLIINGECDEENDVCVDIIDDTLCDDGQFCNGQERCNPETGACEAVSACPPHVENDCLVINGLCDEANDQCLDVLDDDFCDDGDPCTDDFCIEGGFCVSEPQCLTDDDCGTDPCIIASCVDGCCTAITACPPSTGACTFFTGGCDPLTGDCETDTAPDGTPCDPASGSTLCNNGCDGVCREGGCEPVNPSACPCFTLEELEAVGWDGAECSRGTPEWLIQVRDGSTPTDPLNQAIADPDFCSLLVEFGPEAPQDVFIETTPDQAQACIAIVQEVQNIFCPVP